MGFLGFANVYAMRVNLSVAIVAMVNSSTTDTTNTSAYDHCPVPPITNHTTPPVSSKTHPKTYENLTSLFPARRRIQLGRRDAGYSFRIFLLRLRAHAGAGWSVGRTLRGQTHLWRRSASDGVVYVTQSDCGPHQLSTLHHRPGA